jgi:hypothetical protein
MRSFREVARRSGKQKRPACSAGLSGGSAKTSAFCARQGLAEAGVLKVQVDVAAPDAAAARRF